MIGRCSTWVNGTCSGGTGKRLGSAYIKTLVCIELAASCTKEPRPRALRSTVGAVMELSHTKTADEVLEFFRVREEVGLSGEEVEKQRKKYGHNGECTCVAGKGCTRQGYVMEYLCICLCDWAYSLCQDSSVPYL